MIYDLLCQQYCAAVAKIKSHTEATARTCINFDYNINRLSVPSSISSHRIVILNYELCYHVSIELHYTVLLISYTG